MEKEANFEGPGGESVDIPKLRRAEAGVGGKTEEDVTDDTGNLHALPELLESTMREREREWLVRDFLGDFILDFDERGTTSK